jgi:hypothetical protein
MSGTALRTCDLSKGPFEANSSGQYCHGSGPYYSDLWNLSYGNGGQPASVQTSHTEVSLILTNITVVWLEPFRVTSSNATFVLSGRNTLVGSSGVVLCQESSNITFIGTEEDSLIAGSLSNSSAIGTDGVCGSLTFERARFVFRTAGAPAIGINSGCDCNTSIDAISLVDLPKGSRFEARRSVAIGAGASHNSVFIGIISVLRSDLLFKGYGAIGLTNSTGSSTQLLCQITVQDSNITSPQLEIGIGTAIYQHLSTLLRH